MDFLIAVGKLAYTNPFSPERLAAERALLGDRFAESEWSLAPGDPEAARPNILLLNELLEARLPALADHPPAGPVWEEAVLHLLYQRLYPRFLAANGNFGFYGTFLAEWNYFFRHGTDLVPVHIFSCYWQIFRAFHHIYDHIVGSSRPAARLRATVWESIFTHDLRRYQRVLYSRMGDFPTLITGPSGTGKEIIARAIAQSRYHAFQPVPRRFAPPAFHGINISALSPNLIESELFGHRKGAFTGAIADRKGWLETCPDHGAVFLDELGEMDPAIQVKLLRVLETRRFSPVGSTEEKQFTGKLIAATNRDLAKEIEAGRFREDLYYRLCADQIRTPPLGDQIRDSPRALPELLEYMVRRTVGAESAAECLDEVSDWITHHLPGDYEWPGNYRELEQCVRNILIRRSYTPLQTGGTDWLERLRQGRLTADELLTHYVRRIYDETGSAVETARRLDMDRRTVKRRLPATETEEQ